MKFIEVTEDLERRTVAIKIKSIASMEEKEKGSVIWVYGIKYCCVESYEEIKKRIENAYK